MRRAFLSGMMILLAVPGPRLSAGPVAGKLEKLSETSDLAETRTLLREIGQETDFGASEDCSAAFERALPRLIQLLGENSDVADEAGRVLYRFRTQSLPALPALLEDPGGAKRPRYFLLRSFQRLDYARLEPYSYHPNDEVRGFVAGIVTKPYLLANTGTAERQSRVCGRLVEMLTDSSAAVRAAAARSLATYGVDALFAADALLALALSEEESPKGLSTYWGTLPTPLSAAMEALSEMGVGAEGHILRASRDPRSEVRLAAAHGLGKLGNDGSPSSGSRLLELAQDADDSVRLNAIWALRARTPAVAHIRAVSQALSDKSDKVVRIAVSVLGRLMSEAKSGALELPPDLVPPRQEERLLSLLGHQDGDVAIAAAASVMMFAEQDSPRVAAERTRLLDRIERLAGDLQDAELIKVCHHLRVPREDLIELASATMSAQLRKRGEVSEEYLIGLHGLMMEWEEAAAPLVSPLREVLALEQPSRAAISLIRTLGPLAKSALPELRKMLNRDGLSSQERRRIESAIREISESREDGE